MLTREEIRSVYEQPEAVSARLAGHGRQLPELRAGGKGLEARLTLNRHHSSTPPSCDPAANRGRSWRTPSGQKPGAHPGHPGTALKAVAASAPGVQHAPEAGADGGAVLSGVPEGERAERGQVCELPALKLAVTEPRGRENTGRRGGRVRGGEFPAPVTPGPPPARGAPRV